MNEKLVGDRLWRGWKEDSFVLALMVGTFIFFHYFGKSDFAAAVFLCVILCGILVHNAITGRYLDKWTPYSRWVVRSGAAIAGVMLFMATPTLAGRFSAVVFYAALYLLCEWMVWRRWYAFRGATE